MLALVYKYYIVLLLRITLFILFLFLLREIRYNDEMNKKGFALNAVIVSTWRKPFFRSLNLNAFKKQIRTHRKWTKGRWMRTKANQTKTIDKKNLLSVCQNRWGKISRHFEFIFNVTLEMILLFSIRIVCFLSSRFIYACILAVSLMLRIKSHWISKWKFVSIKMNWAAFTFH